MPLQQNSIRLLENDAQQAGLQYLCSVVNVGLETTNIRACTARNRKALEGDLVSAAFQGFNVAVLFCL
jgi:hypothetical protein